MRAEKIATGFRYVRVIRVPRTLLDGNGGFRWSKMVLDDLIAALFILGY